MGAGRRAGIDGINIQSTGTSGFDITFSGSRNTNFGTYTHNFYRYDKNGNLVRSGSQTSSNRDIKLIGRVFDLGTNGSVSFGFQKGSVYGRLEAFCVLGDGTTKIINLDSGTGGSGGYNINHWNAATLSDGRVAVLSSFSGNNISSIALNLYTHFFSQSLSLYLFI